jgi:hypothetical protein
MVEEVGTVFGQDARDRRERRERQEKKQEGSRLEA